ncbi:MAG: Crp/Fnr family transcriptional regulator [Paracoccus sp. (in: a-proteobacteria)]
MDHFIRLLSNDHGQAAEDRLWPNTPPGCNKYALSKHMKRTTTELILRNIGWLSGKPPEFQNEILSKSVPLNLNPGDSAPNMQGNTYDDGIYGLASGAVTVNCAPPGRRPRLIHAVEIGSWMAVGGMLTPQMRPMTLQAHKASRMMYLPMDEVRRIVKTNPDAPGHFSAILMTTLDALIHVVCDLQVVEAKTRIAATLERMASVSDDLVVPLTQTELAQMAGASRRQVNTSMKDFAQSGWIKTNYRSIELLDLDAIRKFCGHAR